MLIYMIVPDHESSLYAGHVSEVMHALIDRGHSVAMSSIDLTMPSSARLISNLGVLARCDAAVAVLGYTDDRRCMEEYASAVGLGLRVYDDENLPDLHLTEVRAPEQAAAFLSTVMRMYRVHLSKNADYSPANILGTGETGGSVRIWDKVARMMSLTGVNVKIEKNWFDNAQANANLPDNFAEKLGTYKVLFDIWDETLKVLDAAGYHMDVSYIGFTGEKPAQNESLDDTIMDLAVYAIILRLLRAGHWGH